MLHGGHSVSPPPSCLIKVSLPPNADESERPYEDLWEQGTHAAGILVVSMLQESGNQSGNCQDAIASIPLSCNVTASIAHHTSAAHLCYVQVQAQRREDPLIRAYLVALATHYQLWATVANTAGK